MRNFVLSIVALLFAVTIANAQTMNGGYLTPSWSYSAFNSDQSLRAISGVHSCKISDSISIRPSVKWGSHYVLKCIYNMSNSTQTYTLYDSTAQGQDTFKLNLPAYTLSFPLPYTFLITGCVVDSTLYIRQYK